MSLRRLIVEADAASLNVRAFCALHGVSTWFFYDLRRRYATDGLAVLEPRSRAPHRVANRIDGSIEDQIVAVRKELTEQGREAGPATIWSELETKRVCPLPSESTIWRTLKARGLVVAQPRKAPKHSGCRFVAERANECWQLDDTTWTLRNGREVKILNVIDDHSRLLVASVAVTNMTGAAAFDVVANAAAVLGWPARFQSDNASVFRHTLADAVAAIGVHTRHSRAYHPQTNGKVERFHQTLKKHLRTRPAARSLASLQAQLDCWHLIYNQQRPHRGIGRRRPADVWTSAPKDGPANHPLGVPTTIYRSIVDRGDAQLGRRHRVALGAEHNGQHATAILTGTACHVFIDGHLTRELTIDPTRTYQPLYNRPGHPTTVRDVSRHQ